MTDLLAVDPRRPEAAVIARAADCLRRGGLVAFPTETVYGLGVNAFDEAAVRRLFEAKGRPAVDPLIVHIADAAHLPLVARTVPASVQALAQRFWPGPLTLVLPKTAAVPGAVTAGLDTVAVRVPAHPVAHALLAAADLPVAAPSANLFSRPSPTTAAHVLQDLAGRIDMVLDGGQTDVGIESTVLDLCGPVPTVLRPGAVTIAMLRELLPGVVAREASRDARDGAMPSPGLLTRHYAPRAPFTLYEGADHARVCARILAAARVALGQGQRVGVLAADEDVTALTAEPALHVVTLGSLYALDTVAARLYAALRELDAAGLDVILGHGFPAGGGMGLAVRDRLRRAASGHVVTVDTD